MNKNILLLLLVMSFLLGSCDWLDVETKNKVEEDEMFSDPQGYRDAMWGIYASMAGEKLYGNYLSFGFVDQLAQLFINKRSEATETVLNQVVKYNYEAEDVKDEIDAIWLNAYNVIAAANKVLEKINDVEKSSDFPERDVIEAEALGIRAMLHFDLLRLFAPAYGESTKNSDGIPYSYDFSKENKTMYSVEQVYNNILSDLTAAQRIYANQKAFETKSNYFKKQFLHINQQAVWAIKARVFHSISESDSAFYYASRVVNMENNSYVLASAENIAELNNGYIAAPECIFGLYSNQMKERASTIFYQRGVGAQTSFVRQDYKTIFDVNSFTASNTDYRYTAYFEKRTTGIHLIKFGNYTETIDDSRIEGMNLIRIPEMYYIMAEAAYSKNSVEALGYLNTVLESRGLAAIAPEDVNEGSFKEMLFNERQKELWGEGQIFYEYKRLNKNLYNDDGEEFVAGDKIFVLPLPDDEIEYGNR